MIKSILKTIYEFDKRIFFFVQNKLRSKRTTLLMKFVSRLFNPPSYVALVSVLFLGMLYSDIQMKTVLSLFCVSQISTFSIKRLFSRVRPYKILDGATLGLKEPKDPYSFPSGHTASAFMLALMIFSIQPILSLPFFVLSCLCGLSRIYLGVHYPSDVLGGVCLSFLIYYILS